MTKPLIPIVLFMLVVTSGDLIANDGAALSVTSLAPLEGEPYGDEDALLISPEAPLEGEDFEVGYFAGGIPSSICVFPSPSTGEDFSVNFVEDRLIVSFPARFVVCAPIPTPLEVRFPIEGLPAGSYVYELNALSLSDPTMGERILLAETPFQVLPAPRQVPTVSMVGLVLLVILLIGLAFNTLNSRY
ncbi:MAG: hypothetical protein AAGH65_10620 [Pseudomonadota bacterium]